MRKSLDIFPGHIDHNGRLTSSMIFHNENPHGKEEIGDRLLQLLRKNRKDDTQFIEIIIYPEESIDSITSNYTKQTGRDYIVREEQQPAQLPAMIYSEFIEVEEREYEFPEEDFIPYTIHLPLWYLVSLYVDSFKSHTLQSTEFYKQSPKKELITILQEIINPTKNDYINHDQWTILSNGKIVNIGG